MKTSTVNKLTLCIVFPEELDILIKGRVTAFIVQYCLTNCTKLISSVCKIVLRMIFIVCPQSSSILTLVALTMMKLCHFKGFNEIITIVNFL